MRITRDNYLSELRKLATARIRSVNNVGNVVFVMDTDIGEYSIAHGLLLDFQHERIIPKNLEQQLIDLHLLRARERKDIIMKPTQSSSQARHEDLIIFISHSSDDAEMAELFCELLEKAFRFDRSRIRCTSVEGYQFDATLSDYPARLRDEIRDAQLFIILMTQEALDSPWVMMELGGRWVTEKPLITIMVSGFPKSELPEMIKSRLIVSDAYSEGHVLKFLENIADYLDLPQPKPSGFMKAIKKIVVPESY